MHRDEVTVDEKCKCELYAAHAVVVEVHRRCDMALFGQNDEDLGRGDEEDYPKDQPGVVAMPGQGGLGMGSAGAGLGAFPIGHLVDTEGSGPEENADHNVTDSPDAFAGGGATTPGHDANADVLDR
jgi:hypothetical protein